ncbi:hypothetical protein CU097_008892 [Rhizopus azygosporus]|uniref:PX domain-containing protein n=1 Tax=Rhizopus azygosporus TaxID=86630 RepID=A0A367JXD2_RHIAZ|nr:hypothetical protein CU097_008892 [Rhizopus azygosporus]
MPTAISSYSLIIKNATVISFEKFDQKTLFIVHVESQQGHKYTIAKRYEDFIQFSQKLQDQFSNVRGLPPKIKHKLHLLVKNKYIHAQRAEELNHFLEALFSKTTLPIVTHSVIVREFFYFQQPQEESHNENTFSSRWKRLRSTSFLSRSNHSSPRPEPSCSTLLPQVKRSGMRKSQSAACLLIKDTIKIKVIYDMDNIIVIQVLRSIALNELRSRILQKFSDSVGSKAVQDDILLLFYDTTISSASSFSSTSMDLLAATVIAKEKDLISLMKTKWSHLEKITLRCIM